MNVTRIVRIAAAVTVLLTIGIHAGEPKKIVTVEGITEYQLDNGLKLLLFPDPSRPTVTVNMTVLVGSRHEGYGETGMAHLLEHMLFKGTPKYPKLWKELHDRGADSNGSTWVDYTNYYETLRASDENLEFAIGMEADHLMNSLLRREDLFSEMTVVRNEFESGENSPENLLSKRVFSVAYAWHNYGKDTIGNRSDIELVPIENLREFYKKYYQPDNVVLVVAGQFDVQKALAHVERHFGSIPRPDRKLTATYTIEPPQDGERTVELRRVGEVGVVQAVYHIPAGAHEDFVAVETLSSILSMQPSGRLYKTLVETKQATSVAAYCYRWHDPSVLDITLTVRRDRSLIEARDKMFAVLNDVVARGVTQEEVDRAKRQFLNRRRQALVNTSAVAVDLTDWAAMGDWRLYFVYRDRMEQVTPADVQRVATKYLQAANRTVGLFIPSEKPALVSIPDTSGISALVADYRGRPPITEAESFDFGYANIEARTRRSTIAGGIRTALVPKKSRDQEINVSLRLHYGTADNLKSVRAPGGLLPNLMSRGTSELSFEQLRDELERIESSLDIGGGASIVMMSLRTKRPHLSAALELVRQVLREPLLDAGELEIVRQQRLATLEEQRTQPEGLASRRLSRLLYPYPSDDIRYPLTIDEQIERIKAVTIEQVRDVYRQFLGTMEGELAIVGDFDPEPTLAALGKILAGWQAEKEYARVEGRAFLDVPGGRFSITTPDKANAMYQAGLTMALDDRDPDYPALLLGNFILGGGVSRLEERVREKDGFSYGVGSNLFANAEDKLTNFTIYAICNPANITKVELAIAEELQRLLKDGIPEEELAKAKEAWSKSREVGRSTDQGIINHLNRSLRTGQSLVDFDAALEEKVKALTSADVISALKQHIDFKRLVVVVAGDFEKTDSN